MVAIRYQARIALADGTVFISKMYLYRGAALQWLYDRKVYRGTCSISRYESPAPWVRAIAKKVDEREVLPWFWSDKTLKKENR